MKKSLTTIFAVLPLLIGGLFPFAAGAAGDAVEVSLGQASLMHLSKVPSQIVVGNPTVADVTVQSAHTLVVFGKAPGGTTLAALDGNGRVLWEKTVVVTSAGPEGVSVHYGTGKSWRPGGDVVSLACTSQRCSSAMPDPAPSQDGAAKTPSK
jgi:hypothetical protein